MYHICPNSFWIKSYDPWGLDPPVPEVQEKILVGIHLEEGREIYPKMSMRTINIYIKRLECGGSRSGKTILVDNSS